MSTDLGPGPYRIGPLGPPSPARQKLPYNPPPTPPTPPAIPTLRFPEDGGFLPRPLVTVSVGPNPFAIASNPVTNKTYVSNEGVWGSLILGSVSVIDNTTNTVVATIEAGLYSGHIAINTVTNKIYVVNEDSANVTVINGDTDTLIAHVSVGNSPFWLDINTATDKIYVTNTDDNTVSVIDGPTNSVSTISVGDYPDHVAVNTVTNKIYVANYGQYVTVINGATGLVTSTIDTGLGDGMKAIAVNKITNEIYAAAWTSGTIKIISGVSDLVTDTTAYFGYATDIQINEVTNKIYAVAFNRSVVLIIDGVTKVTSTTGTGSTPLFALVNPVTNMIYVPFSGSDKLVVIDGVTELSSDISVGRNPTPVSADSSLNKIFVGNYDDNTVSIIQEAQFRWNAAARALTYTLQISTDDFSTLVYDESGLTALDQEVVGLDWVTTYYWRVSATGTGGTSAWSDVWEIVPSPITIVAPYIESISITEVYNEETWLYDTSIPVTWSISDPLNITGFKVFISETNSKPTSPTAVLPLATLAYEFVFEAYESGILYYIWISSYNDSLILEESDTATIQYSPA